MKTARIAIFLTGMIGLGMGGLMSLTSVQSQQEESALRVNESLKNQAQAYVDQFFSVIEAVRSGGNPYYVLNRYTVKLNQGVPSEIESNRNGLKDENTQVSDLALEDRLLNTLKNQVNLTDLKLSRYALGTFELSEISSKEGIFVAINDASEKNETISKIEVILVDPNLALVSFPKLQSASLSRNAYLISKSGKVLAHTSSAYVGTDLRKADGLKETIESLFIGAKTGSLGNYLAIDGNRQQVAFVRAGSLPFAIGVEQRAPIPAFTLEWFQDQVGSGAARKGLGMILVVIASALVMFSLISIVFNRRIENELSPESASFRFQNKNQSLQPPVFSKSEFNPNETVPNPDIQNATEQFVQQRNQIDGEFKNLSDAASALTAKTPVKINIHRDYAEELLTRVKQATSSSDIEKALTQLTSEMSESATLFFRYNRRLQNLTLGTAAGQIQIGNPALFQAYVRKDIEEQVESFASEGKVASLANYGPVNKMVLNHLNIAHFEAWAVTSDSEVSGTPKLVGVLVILNASFRSAQTRPILSRMLKETGNYLFAVSSKVAPRRRSIKPAISSEPEMNV